VHNHEMIAKAMRGREGRVLSTNDIKGIVLGLFPAFNPGSLLPNDHSSGNKCSCWCVGTHSQIFEQVGRGQYLVRSGAATPAPLSSFPRQVPPRPAISRAVSAPLRAPRPWEGLGVQALWHEIETFLDRRLANWRRRILELNQVPAIEARKRGRSWKDAEVFEGMLLAILSNSTDWSKVEAIAPLLRPLFFNFNLAAYGGVSSEDVDSKFVPWFMEHRAGSMQLGDSLKQLALAARKLSSYSAHHGSAERFFDWLYRRNHSDPKRLAQSLGAPGEYKLPGFGIPLAAEALKNIGYDVAKPDRHVNRAVVCFGLAEFPHWDLRGGYETPQLKPNELFAVMEAVEALSKEVGETVTLVDNAIWLLCAKSGLHLTNEELVALATK
jgi:hypothetical protein